LSKKVLINLSLSKLLTLFFAIKFLKKESSLSHVGSDETIVLDKIFGTPDGKTLFCN